jgi:fumarate reductase subunit D
LKAALPAEKPASAVLGNADPVFWSYFSLAGELTNSSMIAVITILSVHCSLGLQALKKHVQQVFLADRFA